MGQKIQTVCGYSCSGCHHYKNECPGCEAKKGKVFWTAYVCTDCCPVYDCCVFLAGGNFSHGIFHGGMKNERTMIGCRSDGIRPVVFRIELIGP